MFPGTCTQSAKSEHSEDNLEEHEDADGNSGSDDDKDVNCEKETPSTGAQIPNLEVQTSPDGEITAPNVDFPTNVFGMMGLLSAVRAAKTNPDLLTLAMGMNLTELGINLNTPTNVHTTFAGPFSDELCRLQDIDCPVPTEYLVNKWVKDKLPAVNLSRFKDDIIFLLFYGSIGDIMQLRSAAELYRRNWRYHMEEKVWICKIPGVTSYRKIGTVEHGRFYYFNPWIWRRVPRDFEIESSKIEQCPIIK